MNRGLTKAALVIAVAAGLAACNSGEEASDLDGLPPGTVQTGPNSFMIPTGQPDEDGCQAYRIHSPGNLVIQIVYYRTADDEFTANKEEAACIEAAPES